MILVEGSQLFTNQIGTTKLQVKGNSSILILNILYILRLGINLLLSKKLYSKSLIFTSNNKYIAFQYNQEKVLEASIKERVYILSQAKPNLVNNTFYRNKSNDLAYFIREIYSYTLPESRESYLPMNLQINLDQLDYNRIDRY